MNEELRTLRRMLETQVATLAWNDLARRAPIQTEVLRELTQLGLAQDFASRIVAQLPTRMELTEAHRLALALLARRIETTGERWLESGGVVALVGPTGVGKTTLIAKLAVRWVLRHGPRDIALISADSVRIGAQEQIHALGRLLGVPAYAIDGAPNCRRARQLGDQRLVLIDTAGLSQRDARLEQELATLAAASERTGDDAGAVGRRAGRRDRRNRAAFRAAQPASCLLTKLDEATSLGGAISALIARSCRSPTSAKASVFPKISAPARAHQLIARAVDCLAKAGATADEDLLRRRFGPWPMPSREA